ncbi:hypothetical protein ACQ4PT_040476 [Festuca glaucescens]
MERPTDTYKETHNLVVAPRDTYVGGLVSNLQIAELIACVAKNRSAAYCKVVEVVAETTAPLLPTEDLLAKVPSDPGRAPPPPPPAPAAPVTGTEAVKESLLHQQQRHQRHQLQSRKQQSGHSRPTRVSESTELTSIAFETGSHEL